MIIIICEIVASEKCAQFMPLIFWHGRPLINITNNKFLSEPIDSFLVSSNTHTHTVTF